ncbi:LysR family transcriptional regulator [Variovorax ginsengisoli]|uniref:DNA-binding transcriptional LysR family regulator n=1 Tax=Variovorax ginsengisoli TaxID=363844 RepID=A0ABT9S5Y2_9BURK|nr:LysR family transcriptional regulator [Variovorax ginsengisoli]MDP9898762.1 DNA-binding transcriptional LysR family regulator [Variovorax ginsengisoli]
MFSHEHLQAFQAVAERGSVTQAAQALRLSKSTVSKYLTDLEQQVGVKLLHRSTRAVSLTDAGHLMLRRSKVLVRMTERIRSELCGRASTSTAEPF